MAMTGRFLQQLRSTVRQAKARRGWARERLAAAEKEVTSAERDLKRWTRPDRKQKRATK